MSSAYVQPAWRGPTPNSGRPLDHATYTRPLGPGPRSLDAVPPTSPPSNPLRARHGAAGEGQPLGTGCRGSLRSLGEPRLRAAGILSLSRARVAAPAGRRAADGDDDVATVGKLAVVPAQSGHLAAEQRPVKEQTRSGSSRGRCSARRAVLHQGRGTGCCDKLPQRVPPAASSAGRDWASTTPGRPEPSAPSIAGGTTSSGG